MCNTLRTFRLESSSLLHYSVCLVNSYSSFKTQKKARQRQVHVTVPDRRSTLGTLGSRAEPQYPKTERGASAPCHTAIQQREAFAGQGASRQHTDVQVSTHPCNDAGRLNIYPHTHAQS